MTKTQEGLLEVIRSNTTSPDAEWLAEALYFGNVESIAKFSKGFEEHKGSIFDRALLQEAKAEIIDMNHYVRALDTKVKRVIEKLESSMKNEALSVTLRSNLIDALKQLRSL